MLVNAHFQSCLNKSWQWNQEITFLWNTSFVSGHNVNDAGWISASRFRKSNLRWRDDGSKQSEHWQLSRSQTDGYLSTLPLTPSHATQISPWSSNHILLHLFSSFVMHSSKSFWGSEYEMEWKRLIWCHSSFQIKIL